MMHKQHLSFALAATWLACCSLGFNAWAGEAYHNQNHRIPEHHQGWTPPATSKVVPLGYTTDEINNISADPRTTSPFRPMCYFENTGYPKGYHLCLQEMINVCSSPGEWTVTERSCGYGFE